MFKLTDIALPVGFFLILVVSHRLFQTINGLLHHRRLAISTGLPYVLVPYLELNILHNLLSRLILYPIFVDRLLPSWLTGWARYVRPDWRFTAKYSNHAKLGDVYNVVTPEGVMTNIADADMLHDIFARRNDFVKSKATIPPVRLYGDNVLASEGHEWRRHRKVVSPPFTEKNNVLVWEESLRQAVEMGKLLREKERGGVKASLLEIQKALSINVISHAGFGATLDFRAPGVEDNTQKDSYVTAPDGHTMSFSAALDHLTNDFRLTILARKFPVWLSKRSKGMEVVNRAYDEFGEYLKSMLRREETAMDTDAHARFNLLSQLISSNRKEKLEGGNGLTDDEVLGNTFLFVAAGHETTSVSVEYALMNLALHQDKQAWFLGKLDEAVDGSSEDPREWGYELCKRMSATACVMYESLRLFPPIPTPIRTVAGSSQRLNWNGQEVNIPGNFTVSLNVIGLHTNPKYWGEDALEFKPERWYLAPDELAKESPRFFNVRQPERATFLPWVEGFRACLGRRFAEVEIVAVLSTLFRKHRVSIKRLEGETQKQADARARNLLEKSSMQIALSIRKDIALHWEER